MNKSPVGIKVSQAFAAFRTSLIGELQNDIENELLPKFNSEVNDIRVQYQKGMDVAKEAPTDRARNKLIELCDNEKKARVLDLLKRKSDFINGLNATLKTAVEKRIGEYEGTVFQEQEEDQRNKGKTRTVTKVKFPDGTVAKVPQALFIDQNRFDRV